MLERPASRSGRGSLATLSLYYNNYYHVLFVNIIIKLNCKTSLHRYKQSVVKPRNCRRCLKDQRCQREVDEEPGSPHLLLESIIMCNLFVNNYYNALNCYYCERVCTHTEITETMPTQFKALAVQVWTSELNSGIMGVLTKSVLLTRSRETKARMRVIQVRQCVIQARSCVVHRLRRDAFYTSIRTELAHDQLMT